MRYIAIILVFLLFSCSSNDQKKTVSKTNTQKSKSKTQSVKYTKLLSPINKTTYKIGENIVFEIAKNDSIDFDSVKILIDEKNKYVFEESLFTYSWNTTDSRVGKIPFMIEVYIRGNHQYLSGKLTLLSDITPEKKTYKIVKTYPHDIKAYTQGLKYDEGFLYEGTGQYKESSLRKIKLETGELVQSYALPNEVFGEGITFYQNKIIQLTWKSWIGYVYDRKEFKLLYKFNYPVPIEGWGVEFNGQYLIVSDGTSNLMFFDPDSFTEIYRIQVYDNVGPVDQLNELEYIDGMLYANRYMTNKILKINPENGKVLEEIDLTGLLKPDDYHQYIDVLNGIAYDKENKRFFVTGKYWPKLFHIEII